MANEKNLKPQNTRTKEEQREIARLGGKASGESRRAKSSIQKMLKQWADKPIKVQELKKEAKKFGLNTNEGRSLLTLALIQGAMNGNTKYMDRVLAMLGEDAPAISEAVDDGFMDAIKGTAQDDWKEPDDV